MPPTSQFLPAHDAKTLRRGGHSYFADHQGETVPSVTTILNFTKPLADRERLRQWRNRLGKTEANRVTGAASRRGTKTHAYIKRYLCGEQILCPDLISPYWKSLEPVLEKIQDIRLVEGFVFHDKLKYGGKVDCIASYNNVPCVFDWKTSDQTKGSVERLYDGPLQLAAYCGAANAAYLNHGLDVKHAALIVAVPDRPAEVFWFDEKMMSSYWHQWQARVAQFYRLKHYSLIEL